uniref:Uncharacterized protein n=1 Tax=Anopheles culicifacies TaxID=139723 RepID=A0A182LZU7_9DIPT
MAYHSLKSNTFIISSESTVFDCWTVSTRVELAVGLKRMTDGICGRTVSFELTVPATAEELGCWVTVTLVLGVGSCVVVASGTVDVVLVNGTTGTFAVLLLLLLKDTIPNGSRMEFDSPNGLLFTTAPRKMENRY